ncbi:hypothetical protein [Enterobacter sp. JBIWA005]|uniref:hypothetical protein n=1 Tax=Enterobacter sp. JBIWA005 TaxID=2831891 RepID=UPI001CBF6F44|nr:hypothetical protein [Enterobacter sp. JBIWA005]UAN34334.1 hypothetical protein KGP22_23890 [Enterobacter sp. JBIWA005]
MALYMVMVADEDDMDRFIMPVSEDLAWMATIAREAGTHIFGFQDKEQHLMMLKTLNMYHEKMTGPDGDAFYFSGPNPGLEAGKPAGMNMADYVYGRVSQYAVRYGVRVINPATI